MDYKLVIILLTMFVLIVILYREVTSIREDINSNYKVMRDEFESQAELMTSKFNSSMNMCVGKIKNITNDNIQRMQKINLLNNQPILTNHFTETEDMDIKTDINFHSEQPRTTSISSEKKRAVFQQNDAALLKSKGHSNYYMSDSDNINRSERSSDYSRSKKSVSKSSIPEFPDGFNGDKIVLSVDNASIVSEITKAIEEDQEGDYEYSIEFPVFNQNVEHDLIQHTTSILTIPTDANLRESFVSGEVIENDNLEVHENESDDLLNIEDTNNVVDPNIDDEEYLDNKLDHHIENLLSQNKGKFDLRESFTEYMSRGSLNGNNLIDGEESESSNSFEEYNQDQDNQSNDLVDEILDGNEHQKDIEPVFNVEEDDDQTEIIVNMEPSVDNFNSEHLSGMNVSMLDKLSYELNNRVEYQEEIDCSEESDVPEARNSENDSNIESQSDTDSESEYEDTEDESGSESESGSEIIGNESDIDVTNLVKTEIDNKGEKKIEIFTSIKSESENDSFEDEVTKYLESAYTGKVTIGSTNSKKVGAKLGVNETEFTEDTEVQRMTVSDLSKITEYTVTSLKKIAKNLNIPTTIKDKGKWRPYKKDELYKKIKDHLKKK